MTIDQKRIETSTESKLLTPQEQTVCKKIAARESPHSQRASALLTVNGGSSQAKAAEGAGLSAGQVKYWVTKFRKQRLGIFPSALMDDPSAETEAALVTKIEQEPEAAEKTDSSEDKAKDSKSKKGKKAMKKTEKTKKKQKSKKEKKSKKAKKIKKNKKAKNTKKKKKSKKEKKSKK